MKSEKNAVRDMTGFEAPVDFSRERGREWLETNGAGAFASSTAAECHTRKYHGLLVTPLPGLEGRFVLLSSLELSFRLEEREYLLAVNQYPGVFHPQGWQHLESFSLLPVPTWIYRCGKAVLKKQVFMVPGEAAVYIALTLEEGPELLPLSAKPLFSFRNSHHLSRANGNIRTGWETFEEGIRVSPYPGLPAVDLEFSGAWEGREDFHWEYGVEYALEEERGQDFSEDRFFPGLAELRLERGVPFVVRAGAADRESGGDPGSPAGPRRNLDGIYREQLELRTAGASRVKTPWDLLGHCGRHFLVANSRGQKSVVAGYPWFGEWGRDTMISLPGLTFCSGRTGWGLQVLRDYASLIRDGLLPNTLGEMQGFTSYNSVDAGLLYGWAVRKLLDTGYGDRPEEAAVLEESLLPALEAIAGAFLSGRVPHCALTAEGLLSAGSAETQLTWMDAKAWGRPVTPRHGLAVDLNALWFNLLTLLRDLSGQFGRPFPPAGGAVLMDFPRDFLRTFWLEDRGFLSDTVREEGPDGRLRPNMLFASAVEGLLPREVRRRVVDTAKKELLTPWGLRTLNPGDPEYAPRYEGDGNTRDSRYHQGTVWPWLLGILAESALKAAADLPKELGFWENYLEELLERHLGRQGMGFLSEVFDGEAGLPQGGRVPPGKGCFAQAWSSGEVLRIHYLIEQEKHSRRRQEK